MAGLLEDELAPLPMLLPVEEQPLPPPVGAAPYNPGKPSSLNAFPHESNFGQGLSGPHVFPTSRLGTTVPIGEGDDITWTDDYNVTESAEAPADTRGEYHPWDQSIELSTGQWRGADRDAQPILNSIYSYRNKPESARYGIGLLGQDPMGFNNFFDPWVPSKENINPLTGHPLTGSELYTDKREEFTRTVPSHEAAHRSIIEQLFGQWKKGRGEGISEMPSPAREEEFKEWRNELDKDRNKQHEIIYLQDWIASKLANDKRGMRKSHNWLTDFFGVGEEAYNIEENLQPGTPTRVMLEELNDLANIELQKQGRPPILNYKDMINEAIGKDRPEGPSSVRPSILDILKNIGRK